MTTRSKMPSMGRNSRTRLAKKQEIAEKVQEIQQRQKNWMQQRDDHLKKSKSSSAGDRKRIETKTQAVTSKPGKNLPEEKTEVNSSQLHKERFKTWLAAREKSSNQNNSGDYGPDVDVLHVSSSRTAGYATPEPGWSENNPEMNYESTGHYGHYQTRDRDNAVQGLMSHKDFDAMADSIVSRVKNNMNLTGYSNSVSNTMPVTSGQLGEKKYTDRKKGAIQQETAVSDLSSHYCVVCQNLMLSSSHTPTIYIPCGHTVCLLCSEGRQLCPTCNSEASSKTCNIMLLQIIQDYHKKATSIKNSRNKQQKSSYTPDNYRNSSMTSNGKEHKAKYREDFENLLTRQEILRMELKAEQEKLTSVTRQITQEDKQVANVSKEEEKVKGQIRVLEEKLRTLSQHREHFENERDELKKQKEETKNKLNMIQDTLLTLEIEMEKVKLLAEQ